MIHHRRAVEQKDLNKHQKKTGGGCCDRTGGGNSSKTKKKNSKHDKKESPPQHQHAAVTTFSPLKRRKATKNTGKLQNCLRRTAIFDEDMLKLIVQVFGISIMVGGCVAFLAAGKWVSFGGSDTGKIQITNQVLAEGSENNAPDQKNDQMNLANKNNKKPLVHPSKYYTVPNSMENIGDKSDSYALLRKEHDTKMKLLNGKIFSKEDYHQFQFSPMAMTTVEEDKARQHEAAKPDAVLREKQQLEEQVLDQVPYDIYNCPDEPPRGYPFAWTLVDVLDHWKPDDPKPAPDGKVFQGLCVFDYQTDYAKAETYRNAELPFVVTNDPQVQEAVYRWNQPHYLERMLGPTIKHKAEYSETNHFMYWYVPPKDKDGNPPGGGVRGSNVKAPKDWKEPTQLLNMTYGEWLSHANVTDGSLLGPDKPHWYFRLTGCGGKGGNCEEGKAEYLFDELPFLQPKESLYIVEPKAQKGIHCRFGMKGVIAENHFDASRNSIAVLGGARRYILAHPNQCPYLSLLPQGHPSARHSEVDWSNPDLEKFPEFALAKGNEVVLQAGDVLYLPTMWFHYIISLTLNFQCNSRSGISPDYNEAIYECGF